MNLVILLKKMVTLNWKQILDRGPLDLINESGHRDLINKWGPSIFFYLVTLFYFNDKNKIVEYYLIPIIDNRM